MGQQTNRHHCDDPGTAPDSRALHAALAETYDFMRPGRRRAKKTNRAADAAVVRHKPRAAMVFLTRQRLLAMAAVLVRTRVGDLPHGLGQARAMPSHADLRGSRLA